jgi:hypothetical protein
MLKSWKHKSQSFNFHWKKMFKCSRKLGPRTGSVSVAGGPCLVLGGWMPRSQVKPVSGACGDIWVWIWGGWVGTIRPSENECETVHHRTRPHDTGKDWESQPSRSDASLHRHSLSLQWASPDVKDIFWFWGGWYPPLVFLFSVVSNNLKSSAFFSTVYCAIHFTSLSVPILEA